MKNKLVVIDGNSILYRSFYALPGLMLEDGTQTNAIYGFANIVIKIINDIKPTHMAVAFDMPKKTFRHEMYAGYKATRKPMPPELATQVEPVKELLRLMNIKVIEVEGIEADDILGVMSRKFDDVETIIVTGDRDSLQLISKNTTVYFTRKGASDFKIMNLEAMKEEYGIAPSSVVDLKALQGDTSDNIPGVSGIGEKTALDLIQKYATVDNVYAHLDEVGERIKNKLVAGREMAYLSYKLAKINCDFKIDVELDELTYDYPLGKPVYDFMLKYHFLSLAKREELFSKEDYEIEKFKVIDEVIDSTEKLQNLVKNIEKTGYFCMFYDRWNNIFFSTDNREWTIKAVADMFSFAGQSITIIETLKPVFENKDIKKILFDSKAMRHRLISSHVEVVGDFEDVGIMAHLVEGLSIKYPEDVLNTPGLNAENPAISTIMLYDKLKGKLAEMGVEKLYREVELPLSKLLFDMEQAGFKVDTARVDELGKIYKTEIDALVAKVYELAGERFNINSAKQLGDILYDKLNLPHDKKRSTGAEVLEQIAYSHEIIPVLLRYRKVSKLYSTYIEGLRPHIDAEGLVHTNFKQTLTTTGRLSSVEPNLQNIPIRSDESREVRSIYTARSTDNVLIDADYSQIELRLLAHFSNDPFFVNAFNEGLDIHSQTACQVFGVSKENVTSEMRRIAKVVNFGIIYGISDFGLANDLKISNKEARSLIESFYNQHPLVREYMEGAVQTAKETGRATTILGRTRRMVDITSKNYMIRSRAERASQNMPLQGSAADIIKLAMLKVDSALREGGFKAQLIMQVHDEIVVDCPKTEEPKVREIIRDCMNNAIKLRVPLECDVVSSYRWSDGH